MIGRKSQRFGFLLAASSGFPVAHTMCLTPQPPPHSLQFTNIIIFIPSLHNYESVQGGVGRASLRLYGGLGLALREKQVSFHPSNTTKTAGKILAILSKLSLGVLKLTVRLFLNVLAVQLLI